MENIEKITFFKRLKISLLDLEEYIKFLGEKFSKSVFYVFKVAFILSIIFSIANIAYIFIKYDSVENYIKEKVPEFSIVDGKIVIDEEEKNDEDKKSSITIINQVNDNMDFNIVKDGYNKDDFINDVNGNLSYILITSFIGILIANFIDVTIFWFINAIMTAIIGEIVLLFSRIKMRFSSIYMLAVYASTLSTILTVVYSIIRMYFNVYVDAFDILYMIISYIYITAVILMIRAELIKKQVEIIKIINEKKEKKEENIDDRVKEEKDEDQENKDNEENKEKNKKEDKDNGDLNESDGTC